jgi:hypothetical protein
VATIGSLVVDLKGNTATFQADMSKAKSIVSSTVRGMSGEFKIVSQGVSTLTSGLGALGVSLSVGTLIAFGKSLVDAASATKAMAQSLSIGIEQLQALDAEASDVGTNVDTLHGAIRKLNESVGEATGGNRTMQQSFVDLGVSFDDVNGHARDTVSVLNDLAIGYEKSGDKTKYLADLSNVMGREVSQLVPMMADLATGVDTVTEKQTEMGRVASEDTIKALDEFGNKVTTIASEIKVAAQEAGAQWLYMLGIVARPIDQQIGNVQAQMQDLQAERAKLMATQPQGHSGQALKDEQLAALDDQLMHLMDKYKALNEEKSKLLGYAPDGKAAPGVTPTPPPAPPRPPHVDLEKTKKSTQEATSAVDEFTQALIQQGNEAGVASMNINDQARALAKLQAHYKLQQAVQSDYNKGLRDSELATQDEVDAVDKLIDAQQDQSVAQKNIAAATEAQQHAYEELDRQAKAAAEEQKQSLLEIVSGLKDIGAGLTAAAGGFKSWKDFASDAIQTVFNLIYDQFTKLKAFGGSGGSIFESLLGPFMSSITGVGGTTSSGGGKLAGLGFAGTGSFMVGGAGPPDSKLVQFMASPGEEVSVSHGHGVRGGDGGGESNVTVQVINNTGQRATAQQSQGADGGKVVKVMVGDALSRDIRERGSASQMLEATYGLKRRGG